MDNNFKKAADESKNVVIPEECPENDKAVELLAKETKAGHYDNINLLVMAALLIFTAVTFLAVNSGKSDYGNSMTLSLETFLSGGYTQSLETSYNNQLPVPETLKAIEERVSLLYGIGNKVSDPVKAVDEGTDADRNSFDEYSGDKNKANENVITTTTVNTDKNGKVTTSEKKDEDTGKGTTAVDRPAATTSTTTTTEETTTTNNDPPEVTTTTTVPIPDVTTTTPTETTTQSTTPDTTQEPPQPSETTSQEENPPENEQ